MIAKIDCVTRYEIRQYVEKGDKCRYCGGNLFTHIHRDLNVIGEQGYTVSLKCEDCGMKMSLFASSVDMIPTVESKLLKIYGIKGE